MLTTGLVKWFSNEKKFGFIVGSDKQEFFFHISGVTSKIPPPMEGEKVEFEVTDSPKGKRAVNVVVVRD